MGPRFRYLVRCCKALDSKALKDVVAVQGQTFDYMTPSKHCPVHLLCTQWRSAPLAGFHCSSYWISQHMSPYPWKGNNWCLLNGLGCCILFPKFKNKFATSTLTHRLFKMQCTYMYYMCLKPSLRISSVHLYLLPTSLQSRGPILKGRTAHVCYCLSDRGKDKLTVSWLGVFVVVVCCSSGLVWGPHPEILIAGSILRDHSCLYLGGTTWCSESNPGQLCTR